MTPFAFWLTVALLCYAALTMLFVVALCQAAGADE
jgi:hypothetical protein